MEKMQFLDSPKENLDTWGLVCKLLVYGAAACCALLAVMALTLL
jgi:hypothetical protein